MPVAPPQVGAPPLNMHRLVPQLVVENEANLAWDFINRSRAAARGYIKPESTPSASTALLRRVYETQRDPANPNVYVLVGFELELIFARAAKLVVRAGSDSALPSDSPPHLFSFLH
eukprot:m.168100 g.168100  ORF g.168100 m.168100 type:complete len:116 (+) comp53189_c0_seq4:437-784(+)